MKTILEAEEKTKLPAKKIILILVGIISALLIINNAFSSVQEADEVLLSELTIGTVTSGNLVKDVRAPGNLVAINRQWLSAKTGAKVLKRLLEPGAAVTPDSIILKLSSPDLQQAFKRAQLQFEVVQAQLDSLQEIQITEQHKQNAVVSLLEIEKQQAIEDAQAKKQLRVKKIIPTYKYSEAILREKQLTLQLKIAKFELQQLPRLQASLLKVEQAKVAQQKLQVSLLSEQVELLNVRAGMHGILQSIAVEEGQEVNKGSELARIADQKSLKAELRVQESQAKDIQLGQTVLIDTRRSKITGVVSRIDPAVFNGTVTVDVELPTNLPSEVRPDLRINGVIEITRLHDVLLLNKPSNWQETTSTHFFKLQADNRAIKTHVSLGTSSTYAIELIAGLNEGDQVILSDTSELNHLDTIKLNN